MTSFLQLISLARPPTCTLRTLYAYHTVDTVQARLLSLSQSMHLPPATYLRTHLIGEGARRSSGGGEGEGVSGAGGVGKAWVYLRRPVDHHRDRCLGGMRGAPGSEIDCGGTGARMLHCCTAQATVLTRDCTVLTSKSVTTAFVMGTLVSAHSATSSAPSAGVLPKLATCMSIASVLPQCMVPAGQARHANHCYHCHPARTHLPAPGSRG